MDGQDRKELNGVTTSCMHKMQWYMYSWCPGRKALVDYNCRPTNGYHYTAAPKT